MKILQSTLFRALCAIIVGILLLSYREQTMTWITIAIGLLFFVSGGTACIAYLLARRHKDDPQVFDAEGRQLSGFRPSFPIVGIGSMLLGLILSVMPDTFIAWLMYFLAAILIMGAISQFIALAAAARYARIGLFFWTMPSLILLVALIAIIRPSAIASAPLFVIGWCMLLYGVVECINAIKIYRARRQAEKAALVSQEQLPSE